jgi:hypothetical protein
MLRGTALALKRGDGEATGEEAKLHGLERAGSGERRCS